MKKNILDYLKSVPDPRRAEGKRYPLEVMLIMMLMGTLSGRRGYRSVGRFCKQFKEDLVSLFNLKHGVPSHVTLSKVLGRVDLKEFEKALNNWGRACLGSKKGQHIAFDGKSVRSSVSDGTSSKQDFVAFVNGYCTDQGLVVGSLSYQNKTGNEIDTLRELIEALGLKGAIFTADANHDSKKH